MVSSSKACFLVALFFMTVNIAVADSFRCNSKLVLEGDTAVDVRLKFGEPFAIEDLGKAKVNNTFVEITRYTYLPKTGKLIKILEFESGILVSMTSGPRVD